MKNAQISTQHTAQKSTKINQRTCKNQEKSSKTHTKINENQPTHSTNQHKSTKSNKKH